MKHQLLTAVGPGRYPEPGDPENGLSQVGNAQHGLKLGQ
jgi:hypothetical protein